MVVANVAVAADVAATGRGADVCCGACLCEEAQALCVCACVRGVMTDELMTD